MFCTRMDFMMVRYIFSRVRSKKHSPRTVGIFSRIYSTPHSPRTVGIFSRIQLTQHSPRTVGIFCSLSLGLFSYSAQASIATEWKYSKAMSALANGNCAQAEGLMQSILVDEPSRPDLLYDLGVASFKNKEYSQAAAYFASAAQADACPPRLQEQSYFNLGNASVELNQLNDAIVHYEKVLQLNEKNEQAKHNLDVVKKMLEEQEQKKQQDQQDKENQEDQKDDQNKDKQDKQDKNSKDGQNGDNGDSEQEGDSHSDKAPEDKKDRQDKQKNKDGKGDKSEQNKDDKEGDPGEGFNKKNQDKGDAQDKKDNPSRAQDRRDGKDKQDNQDKQQSKSDDKNKQVAAGEQKGDKDKKDNAVGAQPSSMQKEPDLAPEDRWILQVLNQRENDEKKTNKQLIRASIDKKLGGQHGQNCW
jgi:Ca-activated chloride channel family protein